MPVHETQGSVCPCGTPQCKVALFTFLGRCGGLCSRCGGCESLRRQGTGLGTSAGPAHLHDPIHWVSEGGRVAGVALGLPMFRCARCCAHYGDEFQYGGISGERGTLGAS